MRIPHDDVVALMDEASARLVMPRFGALQAGDIDEKRANDFVTIADREAERFLAPRLEALLPGSLALGEEAAAADPALLARLDGDTPLWIIDPIDGTRSFIAAQPDFGLIVALSRGDEVLAGWILQPTLGRRVAAEHGAGIMRHGPLPSDEVPPRPPGALPRAVVLGRLPDGARARDRAAGRFDLRPRPGGGAIAFIDIAWAAADLAYFARGWPWDHAAGALVAREGGGAARFVADRRDYTPRRWNEPLLVVREAATWPAAHAALTDP
jgi:fructose-1,6-bisphosphatase/inositol monophosphatase family enzyme